MALRLEKGPRGMDVYDERGERRGYVQGHQDSFVARNPMGWRIGEYCSRHDAVEAVVESGWRALP